MVRAALIALSLWLASRPVRAEDRVLLPACATAPSAPLDGEFLRDLLELEIDERIVRLELGDGLCSASEVEVRTVDLEAVETRSVLPFPEEADARLAARALSLAVAERMRARPSSDRPSDRPSEVPSAPALEDEFGEAGGLGLTPPFAPALGDAVAGIPPTIGVSAVGRLAGSISPQRLSWLVGLRGDVGGNFEHWLGLRGELLALWSHGEASGFQAEASLFAAAGVLVVTPVRGDHWDLSMHGRLEFGVLVFYGPFDIVQVAPWTQLGGAFSATGEVSEGVALTVDLGASWNVNGGQFRSPLDQLLIDLTVLSLDAAVGVRFAL